MTKRPTIVPPPGWRQLMRPLVGKPYTDLHNTLVVLRNEPGFAVAFAFDEMQQQTLIRATPPLVRGADAGDGFPRWVTDEDVTRLQEWLQTIMPKLSRENVFNALEEFARSNPIHPLRLGVVVELAMRILPGAWIELDLIEGLHREPARQTAGAASFRHLKVPVGAASSPSRAPPERRPPPCCPPCRRLDRPPAPSCRW